MADEDEHAGDHAGEQEEPAETKKAGKRLGAEKKKEVQFSYSKMRKEFGQPLNFTDSPPNLEVDIKPDPELKWDRENEQINVNLQTNDKRTNVWLIEWL